MGRNKKLGSTWAKGWFRKSWPGRGVQDELQGRDAGGKHHTWKSLVRADITARIPTPSHRCFSCSFTNRLGKPHILQN
jgi:hypothetical protein